MARREMRWFRYLCEGHKRSGTSCDGMIAIMAVDERLADQKAQDDYDWHIEDGQPMLCDLPHREDA